MDIKQLYQIKNDLRQKIKGLLTKDFQLWQEGNILKFQCCIIHGNGKKEFYGNIYQVIDLNKGILKISN